MVRGETMASAQMHRYELRLMLVVYILLDAGLEQSGLHLTFSDLSHGKRESSGICERAVLAGEG